MTTPIHIVGGLPFVAVTLRANGQELSLERVLLDTGSAGTVFKTDDLRQIGVVPHPADRLRFLTGIGGDEAVIEKVLDSLSVGTLSQAPQIVQLGALDYGIELDGILGLDFLLRSQAVIDLQSLQLRSSR
jgi:hypothetical protein